MQYGLYISAAGLQAQEYRQNVFANNLANAETTGFKRDLAMLQARRNPAAEDSTLSRYRSDEIGPLVGGVLAAPTGIDLTPAALQPTGNKTDMALEGPGFFTVQGDAPGQRLLTRNGRFLVSAKNELVTASDGRPVLDSTGKPIVVNPSLPLVITGDGQIHQGDATVASLGVVNVPAGSSVQKLGDSLLTTSEGVKLQPMPADTRVRQGSLEGSGVNPIFEITNLMEGQRAFEANAKMITYQDTMLSEINAVGRIA